MISEEVIKIIYFNGVMGDFERQVKIMAQLTIDQLWDIINEMRDDIEKLEEQLDDATETIKDLTDRVNDLESSAADAGYGY